MGSLRTGSISAVVLVWCAQLAFAGPSVMSYQGTILESGEPASDGDYRLDFSLYDAAEEGETLWTETHDAVALQFGVFSLMLGSVTPISDDIFDGASRWLQTTVNDTIELPRVEIGTVPYAIHAAVADSAARVAIPVFEEPCPWLDVRHFGAVGDGTTDDTDAIQAAIDALPQGGMVYFPPAVYLIRGIVVMTDETRLVGAGRNTILRSNGGNSVLVRFSASDGGVEDMQLDGNGLGVTGLGVVPSVGTGGLSHQNFNRFSNLRIASCGNGIELQAGEPVDGADSGCWYNVFDTIHIVYTTRGIWLKDPAAGSSSNRNQFYSVRVGQFVQTGVQIDAGETNTFFGCSFEGVLGSAIVIQETSGAGSDNNYNRFFGATLEANGTHIENHNPRSEFYGCNMGPSLPPGNELTGSAPPQWMLGNDTSVTPFLVPGPMNLNGGLNLPANSAITMNSLVGSTLRLSTTNGINGSLEIEDFGGGAYGGILCTKAGTPVVNIAAGDLSGPTYFNGAGDAGKVCVGTDGVVGNAALTVDGDIFVGGAILTTGSRSALVPTSRGMTQMYDEGSSELWFSEYGSGQLQDGHARVHLDRRFLDTVTVSNRYPLKVFIQLRDDCQGVYVRPDAAGFDVHELQQGASNAAFDYRVVGKRKGYEHKRLESASSID